jgi:biopolymer transport protein TolR
MSMSTGGGGGLTNEPNVTPMIDVLLVLLIIFMMILPMSRKAIDAQLPDPKPAVATANSVSNQIVLEVKPSPTGEGLFFVNSEAVPGLKLRDRLKEIYDGRPEKIMFVKGDPQVKYQDDIFAMDAARGGGVKVIGMTPKDNGAAAAAPAAKKRK